MKIPLYSPFIQGSSLPDIVLLQQVSEGNRTAYQQLFEYYLPKLIHYLEPLLQYTEIDYQDVVQDIFIRIWEKKETLLLVKSFDKYLFRMAKNRCLDLLRSREARERHLQGYRLIRQGDEIVINDPDLLYDQYYQLAIKAIATLSSKLQTVFLLSTQEELSLDQIARQLSLPKETVKKRLYLAGRHVRAYLNKHRIN